MSDTPPPPPPPKRGFHSAKLEPLIDSFLLNTSNALPALVEQYTAILNQTPTNSTVSQTDTHSTTLNSVKDQPWKTVFRRATPTGTILSTNFQQLHWHSEDPVVSPLHPDIINDAFIVEVIRKCGWDTRCGFLDGFLKPADPTKNYQQLRQRQNAAWSLSSVEIGIEHAGRKEWDRAIKAYKHALEIDPDCVDAMVGRPEAAIQQFENALRLEPDHPNAFRYMEKTLDNLGEKSKYRETSKFYLDFVRPKRLDGRKHRSPSRSAGRRHRSASRGRRSSVHKDSRGRRGSRTRKDSRERTRKDSRERKSSRTRIDSRKRTRKDSRERTRRDSRERLRKDSPERSLKGSSRKDSRERSPKKEEVGKSDDRRNGLPNTSSPKQRVGSRERSKSNHRRSSAHRRRSRSRHQDGRRQRSHKRPSSRSRSRGRNERRTSYRSNS